MLLSGRAFDRDDQALAECGESRVELRRLAGVGRVEQAGDGAAIAAHATGQLGGTYVRLLQRQIKRRLGADQAAGGDADLDRDVRSFTATLVEAQG